MTKAKPFTFPRDDMNRRFWSKVEVGAPDECWEWQSSRTERGYGTIRNIHPHKPAQLFAHRVSYFLTKGDPGELHVCHSCDNPPCVNPLHLFLGTHQDNMNDMKVKGRSGRKGGPTKLDPEQARSMREEWLQGATLKELGANYGISESTAHRTVKRAGGGDRSDEVREGVAEAASGKRSKASRNSPLLPRGEASHSAKLTDQIVLDMRAMFAEGAKQVEIQRKYPFCSGPTVYRVVRHKTWKHLP